MKLLPRRTQLERDNTATAIAGSIASAIRFLVKQILTENEDWKNLSNQPERIGNLQSDRGLGWTVLQEVKDLPKTVNPNWLRELEADDGK
jgi:hypothetical protein